MNLESTNPYSFNLAANTIRPKSLGTPESTTEIDSQTLETPSDSFTSRNIDEEVLVAGMPTWDEIAKGSRNLLNQVGRATGNALNSVGNAASDLWNGEFKAYNLGPLVGGDKQKAKDITDHLRDRCTTIR